MKKIFFILAVGLFALSIVQAQTKYDLPKNAVIIETQAVTPERSLILWMQNPIKHPNETLQTDEYTCPEETRGSYYSGELRVALVDSATGTTLNTLKVKGSGESDLPDGVDIPYAIRGGHFYATSEPDKTKESKPQIMNLKDYNGDGKPFEFALFDKEACQGLSSTLIGYDKKKDKVIQYPIQLTENGKTETVFWADLLFWTKPVADGFWKYSTDYRPRGGTFDKYEIRYDKQKKMFVGTLTSIDSAND